MMRSSSFQMEPKTIVAPVIKSKRELLLTLIESLRQKGYIRGYIDGVMVRLDEEINLSKTKKHTIEVIIPTE